MRIITAFVLLVIILLPVHAQDTNETEENLDYLNINPKKNKTYGFSIGTQIGFIYGQAFEFVYPMYNDSSGRLLSELKYDMKPVLYFGLKADFGKINPLSAPGFFASLSFKAGIPGYSGTHENRDWLSSNNSELTNFSSHDNITKEMFIADLLLGASIPVKSLFYIKPFLSGSWMSFYFSGKNGYRTYDYENWEVIPFKGEVITYKQDWLLLAAGFLIGTDILHPLSFNISFKISPLAYCAATDHHIKKNYVYKDFTSFGFYLEPEANVSIFLKQFELSLNFAYKYIGRTEGETYIKENGETLYYLAPTKAGAGLSIIDTHFLFSVHF